MSIDQKDNQKTMSNTLDEKFDLIEESLNECSSFDRLEREWIEQSIQCLDETLTIPSENTFLNLIINRRARLFDLFESMAADMFKRWYQDNQPLTVEQMDFLLRMGWLHRRLALSLQNDNDLAEENSEEARNNLEHQQRVRELLIDADEEFFSLLLEILPSICEYEIDLIDMICPWYEALVFFEHSYIDSTLDQAFLRFNQQIIQCFKSNGYERSLLLVDHHQPMIVSARHRFYLGLCTMAMGVHVNCDEEECEEAKELLESNLPRYIALIHLFLRQNQDDSTKLLPCISGIVTFLVNYTLAIDNEQNRQLIIDLFSLVLRDEFYSKIRWNWSSFETILLDSIVCYLIIYCYNDRHLLNELVENHRHFLEPLEKLIAQAQNNSNRRIAIMSQLLLLIFISVKKEHPLSTNLCRSVLTYIEFSLANRSSFQHNRIPMSLFFKSLLQIVKYDYIQQIIHEEYLNLFLNVIIKAEEDERENNPIYRESMFLTIEILWSISFHEPTKKFLKQCDEKLFQILKRINGNTDDSTVKQASCGLLFNLDRFPLPRKLSRQPSNFGKTIGISYDPSDTPIVQMIEQELNRLGHRVWTSYDQMHAQFIPSFITAMRGTKYLIVCLSDMYRLNNRCRTELLYATSSGHQVLSWKVYPPTNNPDEDEQLRLRNLEILFNRIEPEEADVEIHMQRDSFSVSERKNSREMKDFLRWSNAEVIDWCEEMKFQALDKLLRRYDGEGVKKFYDFCKQNSAETVSILNRELNHLCEEENLRPMELSIHEYIQFQLAVEKLLTKRYSSRLDQRKKRWKCGLCPLF